MKILVLGAGVIGSFNAARLKESGQDVRLLARGRRLEELREHGVVLEDSQTGWRTTTQILLVDRLGPEDEYDLVLVAVRCDQVSSALPMLAQNRCTPSVLFLGNHPGSIEEMARALGRERVLLGLGNAGGYREGHVVHFIWSRRLTVPFGELDNTPKPRTEAIAQMFRSAGLPARVVKNVDAYLWTHAAGLPAFAGALFMAGGAMKGLSQRTDLLKLLLRGYREALRALRANGVPLRPAATRLVEWIPMPILVFCARLFCKSKAAVVGGERPVNAAPQEMKQLADEFRAILCRAGFPSPASDALFAEEDARTSANTFPRLQ
ncbi:MAG TPA: 2-dehydropantoate 2-reductase N-terminal domain-containing protein [Candidatus Sulfotelmatobacter sp.]|nr:2-dehydropantoate 2-reductase N-terminal domain-containing protein [Candidatus Sulfotelmatobacter sp.]